MAATSANKKKKAKKKKKSVKSIDNPNDTATAYVINHTWFFRAGQSGT